MGVQIQDGIGLHLPQGGEMDFVFLQEIAQRALFNRGVGLDFRAVRMENRFAAALQVDGGDFQREAVHLRLHDAVRPLREDRVRFQVHRNPHPAGGLQGEESLGVRCQRNAAVLAFRFQAVEAQRDRVLGQAAVHEQAVRDEPHPDVRDVVRVHFPVHFQLLHPDHAQEGILLVRVHDVRPAGQVDLVQADGRQGSGGGGVIRVAEPEDAPVRGRAVVPVGKDTRLVQFHPADVVAGLLEVVDEIERRFQFLKRSQRVHHRRPAGLQEREPPLFDQGGIVPGIPPVRIDDRAAVQREIQEGEILDDGSADPREAELAAFHILLREPVHDGGEHLGPEDHLQGHQQEQHQAQEGQHDIPDDAERFHANKDSEKSFTIFARASPLGENVVGNAVEEAERPGPVQEELLEFRAVDIPG